MAIYDERIPANTRYTTPRKRDEPVCLTLSWETVPEMEDSIPC